MREGVLVLLQPQLSLDRKVVRPFAGREEDFEDVRDENLEGEDVKVEPALAAPPEAEVVKAADPSASQSRGEAFVFKGPDVPPTSSEADWSDVMPKSDDLAKDAKEEQRADASDPDPKKPWWKLW